MDKQESILSLQEEQAFKEDNQVWQMAQSEGWQQVFRPFLVAKLQESFPDPSDFKKEEEFIYAAKVTSVFKKVVAEILGWVEQRIEEAKHLEQKKKGELKDAFEIGKG